jgi:hypothetical protein
MAYRIKRLKAPLNKRKSSIYQVGDTVKAPLNIAPVSGQTGRILKIEEPRGVQMHKILTVQFFGAFGKSKVHKIRSDLVRKI